MQVRLLYTTGDGEFKETVWDKPEPQHDEIEVRTVMTGVCRSDIDMMSGSFGPLPLSMQGHEGLGQVTAVGASVTDVKVGDYVATRGEPAYADYYNVRHREYVKVPEALPKYILEPVACGINVVTQDLRGIAERSGPGKRLLLVGTGFLANVAYRTLLLNHLEFEIDVLGKSNPDLWGDLLVQSPTGKYDVIIDLGSDPVLLDQDIVNPEALIVMGAQKKVTTDFSNLLWKACTITFPSPRTNRFYNAMRDAVMWVKNGDIDVERYWTRSYNRDTEWQKAFADGLDRVSGYGRGYIFWENV